MAKSFDELVRRTTTKKTQSKAHRRAQELLGELLLSEVRQLTGKSQQLLVTADQYTDERGQKTIIASIKLDKQQVGVNKNLLMTIESKGKVYASGELRILGEGERFSGKVNFSEDEADGKDADDDAKKK